MELRFTPLAELVIHYVNTTNRNIFLTGKAGTGKTTLLRHIIKNTFKNTAVAAPTGIAAINAGGVTLHSLLQLPFGTFIPEENPQRANARVNTPRSVLANLRLRSDKRQVLRELELLVIDEVSMLRADLLDCIDLILRTVRRRRNLPFGGVQVLFIGDLNQLPPVVRNEEWPVLKPYYNTIYFFGSRVLRHEPPLYIELEKVYRQADMNFISLLNRLRDSRMDDDDIALLNSYYDENYEQKSREGYIHLTTHNRTADSINASRLDDLPTKEFQFQAYITGNFPESMYPSGQYITLKEGAQVMFIKNDMQEKKRYFNGKIGEITYLSDTKIKVLCESEKESITVERFTWENKKYTLDNQTGIVEEEIVGTFEQYPLRLAWAITVHKSQGLTFERAILDLSGSFAPGQMYVALSRLTGIEGLVLSSQIPRRNLMPEPSLAEFSQSKKDEGDLQESLKDDRRLFLAQYAQRAFDLRNLEYALSEHLKAFNKDENRSARQQYRTWTQERLDEVRMLKGVADKFLRQIDRIAEQVPSEEFTAALHGRVQKAKGYFEPRFQEIQKALAEHKKALHGKKQIKTYLKELSELELRLIREEQKMLKAELLLAGASADKTLSREDLENSEALRATAERSHSAEKIKKTPTRDISFQLFKEGLNVEEIAHARELTVGTIYTHLSTFVNEGKLSAEMILGKKVLDVILTEITDPGERLSELKQRLPADIDFHQIRIAMAHYRKKNSGTS